MHEHDHPKGYRADTPWLRFLYCFHVLLILTSQNYATEICCTFTQVN